MRTALAALIVLLTAGCGMSRQEMAAACEDYGFTRGTPDFARCVMDMDRDQAARRSAALRAMNSQPIYTPMTTR